MPSLLQVFDRDILESYVDLTPERSTVLWDSGVFLTDNRISRQLQNGSIDFNIPTIVGIDAEREAYYSNTEYTDIAEPQGISGGRMKGMLAQLNNGFAESKLAVHLNREADQLKYIGQDINRYWARQAEIRAFATMNGLLNWDLAQTNQQLVIDAGTTFDYDAFVEAEASMADQYEGSGIIAMNKQVYKAILKADAAAIETRPSDMGVVRYYNGRRIVITKDNTELTDGFATYFLNAGAFIAESQAGQDDLEVGNSIQRGNGGGYKTLWTRRDMLIHPNGFSFTGDILTGGTVNEALFANWDDLQQAENWELKVNAELVPFRALITNKA